jgi:hypothetical protein
MVVIYWPRKYLEFHSGCDLGKTLGQSANKSEQLEHARDGDFYGWQTDVGVFIAGTTTEVGGIYGTHR